jgi:predicted membrane chloride channel (bestrophin family)
VAPLRWRSRGALSRYVEAAEHLERALGNARVLARRAVTLINDHEPVPECLPEAVQMLAEATRELRQSLSRGASEHRVADLSVEAVTRASEAYHAGIGFSGSAIVAQVRAVATDLLGTADLSHAQANELVRRTSGNLAQRH